MFGVSVSSSLTLEVVLIADGTSVLGASVDFSVSAEVVGCATVVADAVGATCAAAGVADASGFPADPLSPDEFPPLLVVGSDW